MSALFFFSNDSHYAVSTYFHLTPGNASSAVHSKFPNPYADSVTDSYERRELHTASADMSLFKDEGNCSVFGETASLLSWDGSHAFGCDETHFDYCPFFEDFL